MAERIKGIDISIYQKGISFEEIKKAGVKFAIIRAGCGKNKDSLLDEFVSECEKHGIKYGFYWYSLALTVERAKEEAESCISVIKQYAPDYPVYFDIEDKSQIGQLTTRIRTDMCHAFCDKIRKAGYTAGVYANPSWFNNYLYKKELVDEYEIWLAHWTEDPNVPSKYNYNQKVWQWGLDHIAGYNVDGDLSFHDYDLSGKNVTRPETESKPVTVIPAIIEIGDEVNFKGGYHYGSSTAANPVGEKRTAGKAKVQNIAPYAPHRYALTPVEGGSDVFGWVDADLVEPIEEDPNALQLGDMVTVKSGASDYKGRALDSSVYETIYTVMQIGSGVAPDYIVIGLNGEVTAAIKAENLQEVHYKAEQSKSHNAGQTVILNKVNLYTAAGAEKPVSTVSGTFYLYDGVDNGGYFRVCPSLANVGKTPVAANVTGWIKVSDIS